MEHRDACTVDNTIKHIAYFLQHENINATIGTYILMTAENIDKVKAMLKKVQDEMKSDFLCIPIGLGSEVFNSTLAHANWICFDVQKDTIYRCEPLGPDGVCDASITVSNRFMNHLGKRWTDHIDFDIQGPNDSCRVMSTLLLKDLLLKGTLLKRYKAKRTVMSSKQQRKENGVQKAQTTDFVIQRETRRDPHLFLFENKCL